VPDLTLAKILVGVTSCSHVVSENVYYKDTTQHGPLSQNYFIT